MKRCQYNNDLQGKRYRAICDNSRGISIAGKVLARVTLCRLRTFVVDTVVPKCQCGFRRARSAADMIFVFRLLQEKCRENIVTFLLPSSKSWYAVASFGHVLMHSHLFSILWECHAGMSAGIVQGGEMSKSFGVNSRVKHGCALAPAIFNLFLVVMTLVFRYGIFSADGILIKYKIDGSLFNIHRFQVATKVTNGKIFDLH